MFLRRFVRLSDLRSAVIADFCNLPPSMQVTEAPRIALELRGAGHEAVAGYVTEIARITDELQKLRLKRSRLMALPTQTGAEAGAELASIIFCAASACLCASLHQIFLGCFGLGFWMYRKSTRSIRDRSKAQLEIDSINRQVKQLHTSLSKAQQLVQLPDPPI
jgi:hypothetical protein